MDCGHRKRLHRYEIPNQPRFVTFSCWQRLALFTSDAVKDRFVERLSAAREQINFKLYGWVIMPEHTHLIIVPPLPEISLAHVLSKFKGDFAREVIARWKELDAPILSRLRGRDERIHFWQRGGGYDRNLRDGNELLEKLDYMHDNPRKRGLVENSSDYVWSSARWYAGLRVGELPVDSFESIGAC